MKVKLYDIECYRNYFCVGIIDFKTKEITFLEISEERNDVVEIIKFFSNYKDYLVSFNGVHYDNMVIKYLLKYGYRLYNLYYLEICNELKEFSDKVIGGVYEEIKYVKYEETGWIDIDLFCYWSKMLRISKKISLKSLAVQLNYSVIQELPYKPSTILTINNLPKLRYYNYTHDLGILELLFIELMSEVSLRNNIKKEYSLDCLSWDAPKIASEALLQDYCKITNKDLKTVRNQKHERSTLILKDCLKGFDPGFELDVFKELWEEILNSVNSFSKELIVNKANTSIKLSYGIGGLHSVNENEQYFSNDKIQVVTSDVASLYPNLIINYKCIRFLEVLDRYLQVKTERLVAKKEKNKPKDTFLKLILNSTSGLIDNEYSWLYYPEGAMRLRLIGQLILTKCIEVCIQNNWRVVSANTDGIEVLVPIEDLESYKQKLNDVCEVFKLDLEHEYYERIIYKNVNNYLAITNDGKSKTKGIFVEKPVLGNSTDELVIAKALNAFFVKGINPKQFITNPDVYGLHIYDYCKSNKISKEFTVIHNAEIQQQLNRYYFSKLSPYLFKQKGKGTMQHVNVGEGVELFNTYEKKEWIDYKINYKHYISATQKIIDEINNNHQTKLF